MLPGCSGGASNSHVDAACEQRRSEAHRIREALGSYFELEETGSPPSSSTRGDLTLATLGQPSVGAPIAEATTNVVPMATATHG